MIQVLFTELIESLSEDVYRFHLDHLPIPIRRKIENLRRREDAQNSLVGKVLLRMGLRNFGVNALDHFSTLSSPDGVHDVLRDIQYTKYNRPYLPDRRIDFNITHSGQVVACAIADNCQIGIDVEQIQPVDFSEFHDQFSPEEIYRIQKDDDPDRKFWFYWTIKEAVAKAQGIGLGMPLTQVVIQENESTASVFSKTWYLRSLQLSDDYCAAFATDVKFDDRAVQLDYIAPGSIGAFRYSHPVGKGYNEQV